MVVIFCMCPSNQGKAHLYILVAVICMEPAGQGAAHLPLELHSFAGYTYVLIVMY